MKYFVIAFCLMLVACSNSNNPVSFVDPKPYPNPFTTTVTIPYNVTKQGDVDIIVYDLKGQTVRNVVNRKMNVGSYTCTWNGTDNHGNKVANGIYRYLVATEDDRVSGAITLAR